MSRRQHHAEFRQRAAELIDRAEGYRGRQLEVSSAVYVGHESRAPELIGSCVLVQFAGSRFVFSARHVLIRSESVPLFIGVSPELLPLSGESTYLKTVGSTDDDDHIDLGIVRLSGDVWGALPDAHFASWDELDLRQPIASRHAFSLVGFPLSHNEEGVRDDRMTAYAYGIGALECERRDYERVGLDPQLNLMLGFVKKHVWARDGKRTAPDLYGASGCGLWRYGRFIGNADKPPRLSAIATEWRKGGRVQCVIGTRIHVALSGLVNKYPDIREFV